MKKIELTKDEVKMLLDACLAVIALMINAKDGDGEVNRYRSLYDKLKKTSQ